MALNERDLESAKRTQAQAASDPSRSKRLIAGPGAGKSKVIEEHVLARLREGVEPKSIAAVSFTRAASQDLHDRIVAHCVEAGFPEARDIGVSTLHSLALRCLRMAGLLEHYPTSPLVLDDWEQENVFDAEFGSRNNLGKRRREEIRYHYEAFWATGLWDPANYIPPDPPVTDQERTKFGSFNNAASQLYSAILPGEIIRKLMEHVRSGTVNLRELTGISHIVVDEFQDLNPIDQDFVKHLFLDGCSVFVAGDDDQSIYSFRFASPRGIREFEEWCSPCADHSLIWCFRCPVDILESAKSLVQRHSSPTRLQKVSTSIFSSSDPVVTGHVARRAYASHLMEAKGIASVIQKMISAGVEPKEILILLSDKRHLMAPIIAELDKSAIPRLAPNEEALIDSNVGRAIWSLLRIIENREDYLAHRVLLGLADGVGVPTCVAIGEAVLEANLNFRNLFYDPLPSGVFTKRGVAAIEKVKTIAFLTGDWTIDDEIQLRNEMITNLLSQHLGEKARNEIGELLSLFPQGSTLAHLRKFLTTRDEIERDRQLEDLKLSLGDDDQTAVSSGPGAVRIMSMHGAKGLSAMIVFIPGLEEQIIPGTRKRAYPGLVEESARMLYVSITRARAACFLSYAHRRMFDGQNVRHTPSRFASALNGRFEEASAELLLRDVAQALQSRSVVQSLA